MRDRFPSMLRTRVRRSPNGVGRTSRRLLLQGAIGAGGLALVGCSAGGGLGSVGGGGGDLSEFDRQLLAWPAEDRWPAMFLDAPASTQEAYRFAVANQDLLKWMPCFCGCGEEAGHRSNADCYVRQVRDDGSVLLDSMSFG